MSEYESFAGSSSNGDTDPVQPAWQADYDMEYVAFALSTTGYVEDLPRTLAEAKARKDWPKREAAVMEELEAHTKNETWILTELPRDRKAITSRWAFKIKFGLN